MRPSLSVVAAVAMIALAIPVKAKDVTQNIRWNVQRSALSIARIRVSLGPKISKAACKSYLNILNGGGTVHVNIIGAGGERITSFHVTRDKCRT
jgi:hypothetical protein